MAQADDTTPSLSSQLKTRVLEIAEVSFRLPLPQRKN